MPDERLSLNNLTKPGFLRHTSLTRRGPPSAQAPLPETSVPRFRAVLPTTSKGATPSSSLLRAHAPDHHPPPGFRVSHLDPVVCAGCCQPLLGDGRSGRPEESHHQSPTGRVENWRARFRRRVSSRALSIARWVHSSTMVTFPAPATSNAACGFPALYVFEHIKCVMWPSKLCGARVAQAHRNRTREG